MGQHENVLCYLSGYAGQCHNRGKPFKPDAELPAGLNSSNTYQHVYP
ncbi:hypothetical protein MIZ03_4502 [Rhodoferax lithotrophicus]|uniref:Uncharacterized protein n=1 Tax=Rhodoferax lithotrophicus TaxID=2798804 RepID=A0ABN6DC19_9BURK|nr:hypothetical protein MIZ03_4502 [Rhodoferax sp. MIZ03]